MKPVLEVKNLTCRYDRFLLDHVNLTVPGGTICGLVGENGAGKSTTIRAILNLIRRECGEVLFCGAPLHGDDREAKEKIGVVFDSLFLHGEMTVIQVEKMCGKIYAHWDSADFYQRMEQFQIDTRKKIKVLSRGMKMKVSLAMALSHHPQLLLLDEPTGGLDPMVRDDLLDVFLDFVQDASHAILFSTHITTDLEKISDYITFLHSGKILFTKPKDTLLEQYGILRCGESAFSALKSDQMLAWRRKEYAVDVLVSDREAVQRQYPDAVIDVPTLEEIMLIYGKGERVS